MFEYQTYRRVGAGYACRGYSAWFFFLPSNCSDTINYLNYAFWVVSSFTAILLHSINRDVGFIISLHCIYCIFIRSVFSAAPYLLPLTLPQVAAQEAGDKQGCYKCMGGFSLPIGTFKYEIWFATKVQANLGKLTDYLTCETKVVMLLARDKKKKSNLQSDQVTPNTEAQ